MHPVYHTTMLLADLKFHQKQYWYELNLAVGSQITKIILADLDAVGNRINYAGIIILRIIGMHIKALENNASILGTN